MEVQQYYGPAFDMKIIITVVDRFCVALFSALEQTHCASYVYFYFYFYNACWVVSVFP